MDPPLFHMMRRILLTDTNGAYTISNVSAGTYSIEVGSPGYNSGTISSFTVSASVTGKDLTLTSIVIFTPVTDITMTNAASVQAGSVDAKGKVHWLTNSVYDSAEKVLRFSTNHFSTYGIGYKQTNTAFTDIAAYAKEAVKQMQMAGVMSGKNGNLFDPQGTATRAEVSAVLRRFVELAISSDTAQGWSMNDSGKWMYFKDGKPLTGKQDIDGSTYTFDQHGVTADVPKNLR